MGMLRSLAAAYGEIRQTYAEASEQLGYDLWRLVEHGPAERLDQTENTQPALLAAEVAIWRIWRARGGAAPAAMAGHSLGEYAALVCAGGIAFTDAVGLVAERGRLMQQAVPQGQGGMAAILGLDDGAVEQICERAAAGDVVACANYNAPGQVVIAGHQSAVNRALDLAKAAGAKRAVALAVSVPSHCRLLYSAAQALSEQLKTIPLEAPAIPVVHNVDCAAHGAMAEIVDVLAAQLYLPVRWVGVVERMQALGVTTLIECGPGKVLSGLCKRIDKDLTCLSINEPEQLDRALDCG